MIIHQPLLLKCDIRHCDNVAQISIRRPSEKTIPEGWVFYNWSNEEFTGTEHVCPRHDLFTKVNS